MIYNLNAQQSSATKSLMVKSKDVLYSSYLSDTFPLVDDF